MTFNDAKPILERFCCERGVLTFEPVSPWTYVGYNRMTASARLGRPTLQNRGGDVTEAVAALLAEYDATHVKHPNEGSDIYFREQTVVVPAGESFGEEDFVEFARDAFYQYFNDAPDIAFLPQEAGPTGVTLAANLRGD